jgi:6-phosphogluconolactonase
VTRSRSRLHVLAACADSREVRVLRLDPRAGTLEPVQALPVAGQVMPMVVSADRRRVYAALRSLPHALLTLSFDPARGRLHELARATLPDSMAHLSLDRLGRWLFAASYPGHLVSVSPLDSDGLAGAPVQVLPVGPHAHACLAAPGNEQVFVTALGADEELGLRFDAAAGRLAPHPASRLPCRPRSGPRHLVLHPEGRFVYLLHELDAQVDVLALDASRGTLQPLQTVSALPPAFTGTPWAAELRLSPDGGLLYASERTGSTIAGFRVDARSGRLTPLGHWCTEAQPRSFAIDPGGDWLVAAGQRSHRLALHAIERGSGRLTQCDSVPCGRNPAWVEIVAG